MTRGTLRPLPALIDQAFSRLAREFAEFDAQIAAGGRIAPANTRAAGVEAFLDGLEREGKSVEQWASERRFPRPQVYRVLDGHSVGASGWPRQILAAMGIKRSVGCGLPALGAGLLERQDAAARKLAARAFARRLEAEGKTATDWARERGYDSVLVHNVLRGLYAGRRGQVREIMMLMGLPVPSNERAKWVRKAAA